jgi:hypothetical protein
VNQLPLAGRVVFVDWHGVLSRDPFWRSIRNSATHPLRGQLEANLTTVFARDTANEWMKGLLSSEQVINAMEVHLDRRFREDFLTRRLTIDCARMRVNTDLVRLLRRTRSDAAVVLATDNMDCFAATYHQARRRPRRRHRQSETLADWALTCDDLLCSSDIGALKAEDTAGFFGPWLTDHGMTFTDAVLIDDRTDNCAAFTAHGGTALRWKMDADHLSELTRPLHAWLDRPALTH